MRNHADDEDDADLVLDGPVLEEDDDDLDLAAMKDKLEARR